MQPTPATSNASAALSRAWYTATITDFLQSSADSVFAQLVKNSDFDIITTQRDTWITQIEILREHLNGLNGSLSLEFNIPRMGRRIDVVLVIGPVVFVVEFKVGEKTFDRAAIDQVWDYALDLKNFHKASHTVAIVPILIATNAPEKIPGNLQSDTDKVYRPVMVNIQGL